MASADTILIIDDEQEIVTVVREHLENEGYRVLAAGSCRYRPVADRRSFEITVSLGE